MERNRILFVDDEANLRLTFPLILKVHGFEVRTAATVAEALQEITTQTFDVLISDLNIGEAGDGFTVVSAMRRTQPDCINFILTGFPAFESALAAIQRQVDDYFIKPAKIEELVALIKSKLQERAPRRPKPLMRLSNLLRERVGDILEQALAQMKADPSLGTLEMTDEERINNLRMVVMEVADQLDSSESDELLDFTVAACREHGGQRLAAGYEISMLVSEAAILDSAVYDIVRKHLLLLDTSNLMIDLKRFNRGLQHRLEKSVQAYWDNAAGFQRKDRKTG